MPGSVDDSERLVDGWTRQLQDQAQRYQAMASRVQEISVTERSPDRSVEVTVNSKGLLTNLAIAEPAQPRRMAEVSALIMRTVQAAQAKLPDLMQQAMAETVGTQDATVNQAFEEAKKTFPEPPEDDPTPPPAGELRFRVEDDEPPAAPPRASGPPAPPPQPQRNPRRRPAKDDDEDDFGGRSILS